MSRNIFLGLAQDKLNKNSEAEKAYLSATRIKDNDRTAWQGLINLYEKQGGHKLDDYRNAAVKLALIFAEEYVPGSRWNRSMTDPIPEMTNIAVKILSTSIQNSQRDTVPGQSRRSRSSYICHLAHYTTTSKAAYPTLRLPTSV